MRSADDRVAMCAAAAPAVLDVMSRHYAESKNVPFDCATRLEISERLRDMAAMKRMWGDDEPAD